GIIMDNNRNFLITIALSVIILTGWQIFYMNPRIESQREAARIEAERAEEAARPAQPAPGPGGVVVSPDVPAPGQAGQPNVPGTGAAAPGGQGRADVLAA